LECARIVYTNHAGDRMDERDILVEEVETVVRDGEIIRRYDSARPLPCVLMLAMVNGRPLHVVVAVNGEDGLCIIVTAYVPDLSDWQPGFRVRKT